MTRRCPPVVVVGWCAALLINASLIGCASNEPAMPEGTIRMVDPGTPAPEPGILLPDSDPVRWLSRRLSFPLSQPGEDAWALANESVLTDLNRAVWNGNGLRVGVLHGSRGSEFVQALGETKDSRDTQILSYAFPEELRRSPPLRGEFFADLTIPPRPLTLEYFTRGRLRMLMASRPLGNGNTRVTLTPQHHVPKITLLPRTTQERQLDGRVFNELAIDLTLGRHDILLLGFYQPPPPPASDSPSAAVPDGTPPAPAEPDAGPDAPQAQPTVVETPPAPETPADEPVTIPAGEAPRDGESAADELPPLNLGRGLFTTGIQDDDLQLLFLLRPLP